MNRLYEHSEIVYVKAGLVSDFRHDNKMLKSRRINDYHHAKDAFLNIVVGNVYMRNSHQILESGLKKIEVGITAFEEYLIIM